MSFLSRPQTIPEVQLIVPDSFRDARGFFMETLRMSWLAELGFNRPFIQENHSLSTNAGVLRGLHFQSGSMAQDKLVRCIRGRILDVAVDIRHGSPSFGQYVAVELNGEIPELLLVPIGFAHGFVSLEDDSEVLYKTTNYYSSEHEKGIAWNDVDIAVDWRLEGQQPILSEKDKVQRSLDEMPVYFEYVASGYESRVVREF